MQFQQPLLSRFLTVGLLCLCASVAFAQPRFEPCYTGSYELGRGIVAAEGMAVITGRAFVYEAQQTFTANTPTELGGARVWIGGRADGTLAKIRAVSYDRLTILIPPVPAAATWKFGWQRVEVEAPLGDYLGWVVVMPVSAEIFTNRCPDSVTCINGLPFGGAWVNRQFVITSLNEPIPNRDTVIWFYGTGWRNATQAVAWIVDEFGGETMADCMIERHPVFDGWDQVSIRLPATILRDGVEVPLRGRITLQLAAQQPLPMRWWSFANAVSLTVVE